MAEGAQCLRAAAAEIVSEIAVSHPAQDSVRAATHLVAAVGATTLDPPAVAVVPAWEAVDSAVVGAAVVVVAEGDGGDKQNDPHL